ncbi:hypothetical protein HWV62_38016 [Athelia sp. TMB]|nr:hypothetical protein HWV62_38016 [Athelia sp. TMB]
MGIRNLWELLHHSVEIHSMTELTVAEGFKEGIEGNNTFDLGIDTSSWFKQSAVPFRHQHHNAGENPELKTIFSKMYHLAQLPIRVIFIYDGDKRPKIKRGTQVKGTPHWLTSYTQTMADLFGFVNHTAPGEAEAELALLNRLGHIHAVMTDDVDVFLFGALRVIRNRNVKTDGDAVRVYSLATLGLEGGERLTRGSLILIALLAGGDYDQGISGCGTSLASRVALYGLGDHLLDIATHHSESSIEGALAGWRDDLIRVLRHDPKNIIGRKCRSIANKIDNTFPSLVVLQAYAKPLTSNLSQHIPQLTSCRPDLVGLASFCFNRFGWSPCVIHEKFQKHLWHGVCVQTLIQLDTWQSMLEPSDILRVSRRNVDLQIYHCSLEGSALVAATQDGINSAQINNLLASNPLDSRDSEAASQAKVPIPLAILARARPDLIHRGGCIVHQDGGSNSGRSVGVGSGGSGGSDIFKAQGGGSFIDLT